MLRGYRLRRDIVNCNVVHRLRELRARKDHRDRHLTRLAPLRPAQDLQPVVTRCRCPPGRPRIEGDSRGRVAYGIERAGIPARPWANALGHLVGEEEAEVRLAESWLGDSLDFLQHPRTQIGICGLARADRLPWPGEPDIRQMDVDADKVQSRRERDQNRGGDCPAEYQTHDGHCGRPLDQRRDAATAGHGIARHAARTLRAGIYGRSKMSWWQRHGLTSVPGRFAQLRPVYGQNAHQKEQETNHAAHLLSMPGAV